MQIENIINIDLPKLYLIQESLETYLEIVQDEIELCTESETIISSLLLKEQEISELLQYVDEVLVSHEE